MQEKNSALIGNLACFSAYAIFGFNIISCKNIAIDGNIMSTLSPIMTLIISAIVIKERITWSGITGIALSLIGVIILIFNCVSIRSGADSTSIWGHRGDGV